MKPTIDTSMRGLMRMSIPLMISAASESFMMFMDRAFLARYSIDMMNAAAVIWINTALVIFSIVAVCSIAEVLAGQYNGQKDYGNVSRPIWQMLLLSLMGAGITLPLAFMAKAAFIPAHLMEASGRYFETLLVFAPFWGATAALSGFFAATERAHIITFTAIVGNVVNILLDYGLIFGHFGMPEMGIDGAALATVCGQLTQCGLLGFLFLNRRNRERYASGRIRFHSGDFIQCIRVGIPNALSHGVEIAAWALLFRMISGVSSAHLTVLTACQSMFMLFGFLNDGLKQGVVAIASNVIGEKSYTGISHLLRSGVYFQALIGLGLMFPMLIFPEIALGWLGDFDSDPVLFENLRIGMRWVWLFIAFDGLVWMLGGIMTAGGDTKVLMWVNIAAVWGLAILPNWYFLVHQTGEAWMVQMFQALYAVGNCVLHYARYRSGAWQSSLTAG